VELYTLKRYRTKSERLPASNHFFHKPLARKHLDTLSLCPPVPFVPRPRNDLGAKKPARWEIMPHKASNAGDGPAA